MQDTEVFDHINLTPLIWACKKRGRVFNCNHVLSKIYYNIEAVDENGLNPLVLASKNSRGVVIN